VLGLEVEPAPGVVRLVHLEAVAALEQLVADAAQEMGVAVVPVGDQRMTEHYDAHAVSTAGPEAAPASTLPFGATTLAYAER
jgi:hypothetical protein